MSKGKRRAYICTHKDCVPPIRTFVDEGCPVPSCGAHGRMALQRNKPYRRPGTDDIPDPIPVSVPKRVPQRPKRSAG